jgi:DNA-binding PadR family transcriptional regulator
VPVQNTVPDGGRKVYELTAAGQERVADWLAEINWPKPDLAEFHLKLVAAAQAGLADPIAIVDAQRRELRSPSPASPSWSAGGSLSTRAGSGC